MNLGSLKTIIISCINHFTTPAALVIKPADNRMIGSTLQLNPLWETICL